MMMHRLPALALALVLAGAWPAVGQTPPPTAPGRPGKVAPPTEAPPPAPPAEQEPARLGRGQPVNIRFDFTIIDEGGPATSRKAVSVTVADRQSGLVRSEVFVQDVGRVPLSVDALPILEDGKIRTRVTLDYQPNPGEDRKRPTPMSMRLSFGILLENGRKVLAAQAADPVTDRRVSVEVTATVLK
jgi:hypothetical protein